MNERTTIAGNGRVLVVSSHFPPRQSAGVYRTVRFVRYLPEFGWDVHVLTVDPAAYEDGAKIDDGLLTKIPNSVTVHRTKAVYPLQSLNRVRGLLSLGQPRHSNGSPQLNGVGTPQKQNGHALGLWRRVKDALTVPLITPDRTIGWIPFAVRRGKRVIHDRGIDVLYSSGPPWSNHVIGLKLQHKTGKPWAADFRDPWVTADFRPIRQSETWAGRKHRRLERDVVQAAERVVLNTDHSRDDMLARYPELPPEKFVVIPNGYDPADYAPPIPVGSPRPDRMGKLVFAHAGSFYGKRSIGSFIEALGNVCREGKISSQQVSVRLIGAHTERRQTEREQIARAGLQGVVELLPAVPHEECLAHLAAADVLLLIQTEAPLCVPGKAFEYIALGKPTLTLCDGGATADLVRQEKLGPCVDPADLDSIERALCETYRRYVAGKSLTSPSPETRLRYDGRRLTGELGGVLCELLDSRVKCQQR